LLQFDADAINQIVEEEIQLRRTGNVSEIQGRAAKASEVYSVWEQDRMSVEFIVSSLSHTDKLTSKMTDTLKTFDKRVDTLLVSINQVQAQTEVWKRLHSNINKGLTSIQDILAKFDRIEAAKAAITQDIVAPLFAHFETPSSPRSAIAAATTNGDAVPPAPEPLSPRTEKMVNAVGTIFAPHGVVDLDTYLHNLDSILELERFFQEHKNFASAGLAISRLNDLNSSAMIKIFAHFGRLLNTQEIPLKVKHDTFIESDSTDTGTGDAKAPGAAPQTGRLVQMVSIMRRDEDLLKNINLDALVNDEHGILQLVAEGAIRDLHKIVQRLQMAKSETKGIGGIFGYTEVYAQNRSYFLLQSIESAFSLEAIAKSDEESSVSFKKKNPYVYAMSYLNPLSYWGYAEQEKSREKEIINASAASYIRGTHLFLLFMKIMLVLLRSEKALAKTLMPAKTYGLCFGKAADEALSYFGEVSEQILKQQKRTPNRIYGISVLLDTYGTLKVLLPRFEEVLEDSAGMSSENKESPITAFWVKLSSQCKQTLVQFQADVKADASKSMPSDGSVHELTSSSLNFLRHLFTYRDCIMQLLPHSKSRTKDILGDYIVDVIDGLKLNLEAKAKKAERKTVVQASAALVISSATSASSLANVFLINNYYFIWKSITSDHNLSEAVGPEFIQSYSNWIEEQKAVYRKSWEKPISYLLDDTFKSNKALGTNTSKAHTLTKSRFKSFNSDIAALFTQQVQFFIPDDDLRRSMRTMLVKMVVPQYQAFLAKYGDETFSKHPEKYIKFDADVLETLLGRFFEGSLKSASNLSDLIDSLNQQADLSEAPSI
jgi:hypothetical protein